MGKFVTIEAALDWMDSLYNEQPRPGFGRILAAMSYFGEPHRQFPLIHVTGTNGKGSVTAYTRDLLMSQGIRVGSFTSPHILKFNERIAINHEAISDQDLLDLINDMVELNAYMETTEWGPISGFEFYTVLMARYFAREAVDVAIVEVGIGGLKDCTNIMDGEIAVITTVGLDHIEILGDSLMEVAAQKAGIIKPCASVITGWIESDALAVIETKAQEQKAKIIRYQQEYLIDKAEDLGEEGSRFSYYLPENEQAHQIHIQMLGDHQIRNAATALTVFSEWMRRNDKQIDWSKAKVAIQHTSWFARMERVHQYPTVYVDGAHNAEGLTALKQLIQRLFKHGHVTLLYAGLTTKNQLGQVPLLSDMGLEQVILSQFDYYTAMSIDAFENLISIHHPHLLSAFEFNSNWQEVIETFIKDYEDDKDHVLIITGSLYFVAQVKAWLQNMK